MRVALRTALVTALSIAALGASCERKSEKNIEFIYLVTGSSELVISAQYPFGGGESTTCQGANSWLLRLNTSDGGPDWDYTFLFDGAHVALYGCEGADAVDADGRCADTNITAVFPAPRRVMLEALSIDARDYEAATGGIRVLCRGIADDDVVDADIETQNFPVSTAPVPSPTSTTASRHTIVLRMLRVGESNALPYGTVTPVAPPDLRYGAAAGFSNARDGVNVDPAGAGAGRIVLAGGEDAASSTRAEVWEFDPLLLAFTHTTNLGTGRAGLTANTFKGTDGRVGIAFMGGSESNATQQSRAVDVYWTDSTIESLPTVMGVARAFHASTYLPRATNGHVIALIGGGNYNPNTDAFGGSETNTFEYFLPAGSTAATPCDTAQASWRLCVPSGGSTLTNARMRMGAQGHVAIDLTTLAWVAGGQASTSVLTAGQTFTGGQTGTFTAGAALNAGAIAPVTVTISSSGNTALTGRPIFIGGYSSAVAPFTALTNSAYLNAAGSAVAIADPLAVARGDATGTVLRDKSVLIAGGRNDVATAGVLPFELFVPGSGAAGAAGTFELIPDAVGSEACETGGDAGCASLLTPRFGHTATRVDATRTWIDGAVLIAGGGPGTATPELFVPAMRCGSDHVTPVTALGNPVEPLSNDQLPALCDRDRAGTAIANPKAIAQ